MPSICVFCGSSPGNRPVYLDAARRLGDALAQRGHTVVYGGASCGLMAAVADAALDAGGMVEGVIPTVIQELELSHSRLSRLHRVDTMHQRKALMAELSDGFIALPGGMGTLDELCEILTWAQLDIHRKPIGLLDVGGYWRHFTAFLDHAVGEGFLRAVDRDRLLVEEDVDRLLTRMIVTQ